MRIKKRVSFIIFFLLVIFLLTACAKKQAEEEAGAKAEVSRSEYNQSVREMIVALNIDGTPSEIFMESVWLNRNRFIGGILFQGLLMAEGSMNNIKPDLCSEYSISPDGLTYVFQLQENIYWHDGTHLTTEDVVWSIQTCLKAQNVNGYLKKVLQRIDGAKAYEIGNAKGLKGLKVEGNYLVLQLSERDDSFLSGLAQLAILPKHCFQGVEPNRVETSEFWKNPIGSGPYKVREVIEKKEILFEVNEDYNGKIPKIERIRCMILENPKTDRFDFAMSSDPKVIEKYALHPEYEAVQTGNLYYWYLMFNVDGRSGVMGELLKNKKIRQALYMGLDRTGIVEKVYGETAIHIDTGVEKDSVWYDQDPSYITEYDPKTAGKILKEEGFDFEETLVLTRYSEDELSCLLLEEIADCWRKLGIKVVIEPITSAEIDRMWKDTDWYNIALKNLAAVDYSEWYYEYSGSNQLWSKVLKDRNEFDLLVDELNKSSWAYERKEIYGRLQQLELEHVYKIPLAIVPQYVIYNQRNLDLPEMDFPNLWYYFDIHIEDWHFKQ